MNKKYILPLLLLSLTLIFVGCGEKEEVTASSAEFGFASTTFDDDAIDDSVFNDYDLTLVNIWGTYCPPCVVEIPELEVVHQNLPDGVNILGMCIDVTEGNPDTENLELGLEIMDDLGATYTNIQNNEALHKGPLSKFNAVPTTVFIDSEGNFVGEPVVGIPVKSQEDSISEAYLEIIAERLEMSK